MIPWPESWLTFWLAFYPALMLAVAWHELGHYLVARLLGHRVLATAGVFISGAALGMLPVPR